MDDRLITIATDHYTAAEVLKARLEDAGIKCFLKNVNIVQGALSEGVRVQISEKDVEKALQLIHAWKAEQEKTEMKDIKDIRRILVPVDFSDYSKNACIYALDLAYKLKSDLKIFHVYYAPIIDLVPITDAYSVQVDMDINLREMEESARKKLVSFVKEIKSIAKERSMEEVKISYSLREGIIEDEVASMADNYKPGIIIVGTKGKGEKQTEIIGSVVYRICDKSRVPVLAIPEKSEFTTDTEVRNVIYATEFDDSDFVAIRRLMNILSPFNVNIYCIHIAKDGKKTWNEAKMNALKDYFKKVKKGVKIECDLLEGSDIFKELEDYIEKQNIDLIALSNRKRGLIYRLFNPDITKQLLLRSTMPLLIFRS